MLMGHKEPMTIAAALRQIQKNELVLPAIQREYVWKPSQVIKLFDSLMQGYPVGSFLSWRLEPATVSEFKFYGFMRDYSGYDKKHNPVVDLPSDREVVAVLDGQQRLTSLNIGLRGTYAFKNKNGWASRAWSYPERKLYLNLLGEAPPNELGLKYNLQFLTDEQVADAANDSVKNWFPVGRIFDASEMAAVWKLAIEFGVASDETASDMLSKLWTAVHGNASLHFYEEDVQDIERVLDIFVRVNSGGTVLSYSDLLMSIATAQWKERDARAAVHDLVDELNATGQGFNFSLDTVLKSGLVLSDVGDIAFKVKNFTTTNMAKLEENWDAIGRSLRVATELLSDFGLAGGLLAADSVLIPIAYYVHRRGIGPSYRVSAREDDKRDRAALKSWVLRSLIVRGVWGSGLDTLLRDLRDTIKVHGDVRFPLAEIERAMALRGKSLAVSDALVEDVLQLKYGSARTWAVLAVVFNHVDTRMQYHVDHVFPAARLDAKRLREARLSPSSDTPMFSRDEIAEILDRRDQLPNLELLDGPENIGKSDTPTDEWVTSTFAEESSRSAFLERNALPGPLPHAASDFLDYFASRRVRLEALIRLRLATQEPSDANQGEKAVPAVDLADNIDEALTEGDSDD